MKKALKKTSFFEKQQIFNPFLKVSGKQKQRLICCA